MVVKKLIPFVVIAPASLDSTAWYVLRSLALISNILHIPF